MVRTSRSRAAMRNALAIHDALASQLADVCLAAGALELTATDDAAQESARAVRETAKASLADLRQVVQILRNVRTR